MTPLMTFRNSIANTKNHKILTKLLIILYLFFLFCLQQLINMKKNLSNTKIAKKITNELVRLIEVTNNSKNRIKVSHIKKFLAKRQKQLNSQKNPSALLKNVSTRIRKIILRQFEENNVLRNRYHRRFWQGVSANLTYSSEDELQEIVEEQSPPQNLEHELRQRLEDSEVIIKIQDDSVQIKENKTKRIKKNKKKEKQLQSSSQLQEEQQQLKLDLSKFSKIEKRNFATEIGEVQQILDEIMGKIIKEYNDSEHDTTMDVKDSAFDTISKKLLKGGIQKICQWLNIPTEGDDTLAYKTIKHSLYGIRQMRNIFIHGKFNVDHLTFMLEYIRMFTKGIDFQDYDTNERLHDLRINAYYWRYPRLFRESE